MRDVEFAISGSMRRLVCPLRGTDQSTCTSDSLAWLMLTSTNTYCLRYAPIDEATKPDSRLSSSGVANAHRRKEFLEAITRLAQQKRPMRQLPSWVAMCSHDLP
jgi:hypothetical protein